MWTGWEDYDFHQEVHCPPDQLHPKKREKPMCDIEDFFDDLAEFGDWGDWQDFAFLGGAIGFIEERIEEELILDRLMMGIIPDDEDGAP